MDISSPTSVFWAARLPRSRHQTPTRTAGPVGPAVERVYENTLKIRLYIDRILKDFRMSQSLNEAMGGRGQDIMRHAFMRQEAREQLESERDRVVVDAGQNSNLLQLRRKVKERDPLLSKAQRFQVLHIQDQKRLDSLAHELTKTRQLLRNSQEAQIRQAIFEDFHALRASLTKFVTTKALRIGSAVFSLRDDGPTPMPPVHFTQASLPNKRDWAEFFKPAWWNNTTMSGSKDLKHCRVMGKIYELLDKNILNRKTEFPPERQMGAFTADEQFRDAWRNATVDLAGEANPLGPNAVLLVVEKICAYLEPFQKNLVGIPVELQANRDAARRGVEAICLQAARLKLRMLRFSGGWRYSVEPPPGIDKKDDPRLQPDWKKWYTVKYEDPGDPIQKVGTVAYILFGALTYHPYPSPSSLEPQKLALEPAWAVMWTRPDCE